MFDTACKFLVETFSADFATWLLGEPVTLTELSPSELSLEPIRADALILLQSTATILHLEFQSRPDADMAFRMADYRLRAYRRFPKKVMRQIVIYLQPTQSPSVYQTSFEIPGMRHEFEVIRLWEESPGNFLTRPGLLPFAVLTQTADRPQLLRQVANQIEQLADKRMQSNVAASTAILAGLLLEKNLIQQVLRRELMQASVIYQDIWEEARQEGLQEGRQEGRQEGLQEGLQEGRQEGLREGRQEGLRQGRQHLIQRQLTRRLGVLAEEILSQLAVLSLVQLEDLGEALLEFGAPADLETWLRSQQAAVAASLEALTDQLGELSPEVRADVQALSLLQLEELRGVRVHFADLDDLRAWLEALTLETEELENNHQR